MPQTVTRSQTSASPGSARCETAAGDHDRGAALVEYALLISLIVLVCIAAITLMGDNISPLYSSAVDGLDP